MQGIKQVASQPTDKRTYNNLRFIGTVEMETYAEWL
jgi:hypothetical protein